MLRKTTLILSTLICASSLSAQTTYSVNNLLNYARGTTYIQRENLVDLNLFHKKWSVYSQLEISRPPEFGPSSIGMNKIRLEYTTDWLHVNIGDVYPLWNQGLLVNLRYEKNLGYDSGIRGVELWGAPLPGISVSAITGKQEFHKSSPQSTDPRSHNWTETNVAQGISVAFDTLRSLGKLSFSALHISSERPYHFVEENADGKFVTKTGFHAVESWYAEGFWEQSIGDWDLNLNHALKISRLANPWNSSIGPVSRNNIRKSQGTASYASLTGFFGKVGVTIEYKNYRYDLRHPGVWQDLYGNWPTQSSPFQRPPIAYREYSTSLLTRQTHTLNQNDEVGFQIEVNYTAPGDIYFTGNVSAGSRHRVYRRTDQQYELIRRSPLLPLFRDGAFPFYQWHLEGEKYLMEHALYVKQSVNSLYTVKDFAWRVRMNADTESIYRKNMNSREIWTTNTVLSYTFPAGSSLEINHENQWITNYFTVQNSARPFSEDNTRINSSVLTTPIYNRYITLSYTHQTGTTIALLYDYASRTQTGDLYNIYPAEDNPLEGFLRDLGIPLRNKWFGIEITLNLLQHHQITLFYGSEQGGLRCANGVCREIPPFEDGFRLSIQSFF